MPIFLPFNRQKPVLQHLMKSKVGEVLQCLPSSTTDEQRNWRCLKKQLNITG